MRSAGRKGKANKSWCRESSSIPGSRIDALVAPEEDEEEEEGDACCCGDLTEVRAASPVGA